MGRKQRAHYWTDINHIPCPPRHRLPISWRPDFDKVHTHFCLSVIYYLLFISFFHRFPVFSPDFTKQKQLNKLKSYIKKKNDIKGLGVPFLPSPLLSHTLHLFPSPSLLVGVKRVMSADLCVLLHRPITSPWGGCLRLPHLREPPIALLWCAPLPLEEAPWWLLSPRTMGHHPPRPAARCDGPLAGCRAPECDAQSWESKQIGRYGWLQGRRWWLWKNLHKHNASFSCEGRTHAGLRQTAETFSVIFASANTGGQTLFFLSLSAEHHNSCRPFINLGLKKPAAPGALTWFAWRVFTCGAVLLSAAWARVFWRDVAWWDRRPPSTPNSPHRSSASADTGLSPGARPHRAVARSAPARTRRLTVPSASEHCSCLEMDGR